MVTDIDLLNTKSQQITTYIFYPLIKYAVKKVSKTAAIRLGLYCCQEACCVAHVLRKKGYLQREKLKLFYEIIKHAIQNV